MKKEVLWTHGNAKGVRITLEAGEELGSHSAPGRVFIVCCKGEGVINLPDGEVQLSEGKVIDLEPGIPHSVKASKDLTLYLTLFMPK